MNLLKWPSHMVNDVKITTLFSRERRDTGEVPKTFPEERDNRKMHHRRTINNRKTRNVNSRIVDVVVLTMVIRD